MYSGWTVAAFEALLPVSPRLPRTPPHPLRPRPPWWPWPTRRGSIALVELGEGSAITQRVIQDLKIIQWIKQPAGPDPERSFVVLHKGDLCRISILGALGSNRYLMFLDPGECLAPDDCANNRLLDGPGGIFGIHDDQVLYGPYHEYDGRSVDELIAAITAALAQPAPPGDCEGCDQGGCFLTFDTLPAPMLN